VAGASSQTTVKRGERGRKSFQGCNTTTQQQEEKGEGREKRKSKGNQTTFIDSFESRREERREEKRREAHFVFAPTQLN
jgi:hypothetical protein